MKTLRTSLLLSMFISVMVIGFSSNLNAQSSNEEAPRYHELPEFENDQNIEMVAEEAENTLQIAHLSFAELKGLTLAKDATTEDLSERTIRLSDMPVQKEEGMNTHSLEELAPIEFIASKGDESGSGIIISAGACPTRY